MPNPIAPLIDKHLGPQFLPSLLQRVMGLAKDFWMDGPDNLLNLNFNWKLRATNKHQMPTPMHAQPQPAQPSFAAHVMQAAATGGAWHAEAGEISEKMWGTGFVTPGDIVLSDIMIKPLGITKEMTVLDLSAGLGGRVRYLVEKTNTYVTGLEPDAAVAARGMELSVKAGKAKHATIAHYDPANLKLTQKYDCVIARETFYRSPDYSALLDLIGQHTKPKAQICFTDYIVDAEHRANPAIAAWLAHEKGASPRGLVEVAERWAKVGFDLRVHEDQSTFYKTEVIAGMKRLMDFLATGIRPDRETSETVLHRIETWKYRLAAMDGGMKFYRFYGTKG